MLAEAVVDGLGEEEVGPAAVALVDSAALVAQVRAEAQPPVPVQPLVPARLP